MAKSGYIEVPDAIMERLNPYKDHRLEITKRDGALKIKKKSWSPNEELVELYENKVKLPVTELLIPKNHLTSMFDIFGMMKLNLI